uniref:HBS1-like protein N-terminal domain-containing protein n=1 Tax=Jaculus jaculus TaxID=51337 RepID=A0A8C5LFH7_JACJA
MARHRDARGYNYDEDFEDDDLYGQSVEDDYCISLSTAAQFIYSGRDRPVEEYDYEELKDSSNSLLNHQLSEIDQARLHSCLDHMKEVLGDAMSDEVMIEAILKNKFDVQSLKGKRVLFSSFDVSDDSVQSSDPQSNDHLYCSGKPFDFSSLVAKCGSHNSTLVPSHCLHHRKKKLDRPKSEKKLEPCKSTKELSLADLIHDLPRDSCSSQPSVGLPPPDSLGSLLSKTRNAEFLSPPAFEGVSKDDLAFKGIPDLKSLMRENTASNDSLFIKNSSLPDFQSIPVQSTLGNLSRFLHLPIGNISLVEQSARNNILISDRFPLSQCEHPSLTELLQEHKGNSPGQHTASADMCIQSSASLRSVPLSQLATRCQSSNGISELTGSLSSLAFCKTSPTRDLENLSLSDLIGEMIDLDHSKIEKDSFESSLSEMRNPGIDSNIDLSVLIRTPAFDPQPIVNSSVAPTPGTKVLSSKLGNNANSTKDSKKNKKGSLNRKPPLSVSWTKALEARPSAFAST